MLLQILEKPVKNLFIEINFKKRPFKMSAESNFNNSYKKKLEKTKGSFNYDTSFPGTAPPGLLEENFPLSEVLQLSINNLNVQEFSRDQHCGVIRGSDESILNWLESKNKVKPREKEDLRDDLIEKNQILIEDDFDFENGEETLENFFGQPNSNLSDFI